MAQAQPSQYTIIDAIEGQEPPHPHDNLGLPVERGWTPFKIPAIITDPNRAIKYALKERKLALDYLEPCLLRILPATQGQDPEHEQEPEREQEPEQEPEQGRKPKRGRKPNPKPKEKMKVSPSFQCIIEHAFTRLIYAFSFIVSLCLRRNFPQRR